MNVQPVNRVAYYLEPRFPGGTSSAIASELSVTFTRGLVQVHADTETLFRDRFVNSGLQDTLSGLGCDIVFDSPRIDADTVIVHNPAFLKTRTNLNRRITARQIIVVAHENFLRPGGYESFDVAHCLNLLDRATLATRKIIAPISAHNRATVLDWLGTHPEHAHWQVLAEDWFNICDFDMAPPTKTPQDRRGRLSRPGLEKFPSTDDLDLCFPDTAQSNVILGADMLMKLDLTRPHWTMLEFGAMDVADFFDRIDFLVYFTAPTWRESFGRVLAEAIAAGKVVLSDPDTAATFGPGVVACTPGEVDQIINGFVRDPARYARQVRESQTALKQFSADAFASQYADLVPAREPADVFN